MVVFGTAFWPSLGTSKPQKKVDFSTKILRSQEDGPPDPSPTVSVWEFLSLLGLGKSGVSSQGMWAKSWKNR